MTRTKLYNCNNKQRALPQNACKNQYLRLQRQSVLSCLDQWLSKVCAMNLKGPATISQGIRGYISVLAAMKFSNFLIKRIMFCLKYCENSLIGDVFISYDRISN
jgi:hypothetical protein